MIQFLAKQVHLFRERGGRVLFTGQDDSDVEVPLDAYFGKLLG